MSNIQKFETTKLYKDSRIILLNNQHVVKNLPKNFKYTVGSELTCTTFNLTKCVALVYMESDIEKKLTLFDKAIELCVEVLIFYRLLNDLSFIDKKTYISQVDLLVTIQTQLEKWKTSTLKK